MTAKVQGLLTVWDTGSVVAVVPMSTVIQTGTEWRKTSDIDFILEDGGRYQCLWAMALVFFFR